MKRRQWILLAVSLVLMVGAAFALTYLQSRQRLGPPGLKSSPIPGELKVQLELPAEVPGYAVDVQEPDPLVVNALPNDTSIAQATCRDAAGRDIHISAVMMGTDRTSIHKPEICLPGAGWTIDGGRSSKETVHIDEPVPFDLPVMKIVSTRTVESNGQKMELSGIYVYWFVAGDAVTEDHGHRMWLLARHLLQTGELQRWAYVSYFTVCAPGGEDAAFEDVKQLIRSTVPKFQITRPGAGPI